MSRKRTPRILLVTPWSHTLLCCQLRGSGETDKHRRLDNLLGDVRIESTSDDPPKHICTSLAQLFAFESRQSSQAPSESFSKVLLRKLSASIFHPKTYQPWRPTVLFVAPSLQCKRVNQWSQNVKNLSKLALAGDAVQEVSRRFDIVRRQDLRYQVVGNIVDSGQRRQCLACPRHCPFHFLWRLYFWCLKSIPFICFLLCLCCSWVDLSFR